MLSADNRPVTPYMISSQVAINAYFGHLRQAKDSKRDAGLFLVILVSVALFALINARSFTKWIIVFACVGLISSTLLPGTCITCSTGATRLEALALPCAALGFGILIIHLIFYPSVSWLRVLGLFILATIPFGQLVLVSSDPKLCPVCLIIGTCSFLTEYPECFSDALRMRRVGLASRPALVGTCCFLLAVMGKTLLLPILSPQKIADTTSPAKYVGANIADLIQDGPATDNGVVLVTLWGCEGCDLAKASLLAHHIVFAEISPCSALNTSRCFKKRSEGFSAPLLLKVGADGQIVYSFEGWPSSPKLQSEIYSALEQSETEIDNKT